MRDHSFGFFIFSFWWLIFPIMGFGFGALRMWLVHQQSKQAMEILKTYAAQGKEPPPEVMAAVTGGLSGRGAGFGPGPYPDGGPYAGPGAWGGWGWGRYGWSGWRGPLWSWSRVVTFAAIAIGFAFAGAYVGDAEAERAFQVVAIIMGVMAAGFGVMALVHTLMFRHAPKP